MEITWVYGEQLEGAGWWFCHTSSYLPDDGNKPSFWSSFWWWGNSYQVFSKRYIRQDHAGPCENSLRRSLGLCRTLDRIEGVFTSNGHYNKPYQTRKTRQKKRLNQTKQGEKDWRAHILSFNIDPSTLKFPIKQSLIMQTLHRPTSRTFHHLILNLIST